MKKLFLRAEFGPLWEPWEEDEIGRKTYLDDWFMLLIHSYLITTGSVYTVDAAQSYT